MSASRTKYYLDKQNGKWMGVCSTSLTIPGSTSPWVRVGAIVLTIMGAGCHRLFHRRSLPSPSRSASMTMPRKNSGRAVHQPFA